MCGRFSLKTPPPEIMQHFGLETEPPWRPRYNIAPTQDVGIIRATSDHTRSFVLARWGLVPPGGPGPNVGPPLINARSETANEKSPFRMAFDHQRCLIPADGFYEWRKRDRWRQPYRIGLKNDSLFAFAGLWDECRTRGGDTLTSCTILTTEANEILSPIHDRMPVLLPPDAYARWLDPDKTAGDLQQLLRPFPTIEMQAFPISDRINSVLNDDAECIREVPEPLEFDLFS